MNCYGGHMMIGWVISKSTLIETYKDHNRCWIFILLLLIGFLNNVPHSWKSDYKKHFCRQFISFHEEVFML